MKDRVLSVLRAAAGLSVFWLAACGGGGGGGAGDTSSVSTEPASTLDAPPVLVEAFPNLTFDSPVVLLQHPSEPQRWYVVERGGLVRTFVGADATASQIVLDLSDKVDAAGEGGLLGMAFHPAFGQNGQIYVNYTGPGGPLTTFISAFSSNDGGLSFASASEEILLSLDQPFSNHNGGWIAFGPDGYLYIALGDGGSGGDPDGNAQNRNTLLGSILRIDVDRLEPDRPYAVPLGNPFSASAACGVGEGCPEIYAWGFRNPWRGSFDAQTGDLWVADVGQDDWEEINLVAAGQNYGWNILEGTHCYQATTCNATGLAAPVAEYDHANGDHSITGGYVYRGSAVPALGGDYIYGDFVSGRIWRLVDAASGGRTSELLIESGLLIVSFGQDSAGEIYVIDFSGGRIFRLAPGNGA
ncbi:MAG: glucose sorbosone dehydrogenase [Desulfobacteraceae bacterium]|nr:MAG: glucose sorbosone dehydrogenase [Desulfobacteraceae bacterium]